MPCHFFYTCASINSDLATCRRLVRGERDRLSTDKDLIDMERPAQDRQQKAWLRRRLHGAIVRAHLAETLLPFCEMRQTFTVLIKI